MASIRYYLNTRRVDKFGKSQLQFRIGGIDKTATYIPTQFHLLPEDWDSTNNRIKSSCTYYDVKDSNIILQEQFLKLNKFIVNCEDADEMTATEIRDKYLGKEQEKKIVNIDVYDLFDKFIAVKIAENPNGKTNEVYMHTKRTLLSFAKALRIKELTTQFLERFYQYLLVERKNKINTISIHFRNLRAVYNYAITQKLAKREDYPFSNFKIKQEKTPHRVIAKNDLFKLFDYTPEGIREEKAVDLFKLSFYLRGMNFKDMLYAKKTDIYNGRLEYKRAKTHKFIGVRIEPEAQAIMDKYAGDKLILNFLEKKALIARPNRSTLIHEDVTKQVGKTLKSIFKKLHIDIPVSSYYARHTWATTARKIGIDYDIIHNALGHSNNDVTAIYIQYDDDDIDNANRKVINYVLRK